MPRHLFSQKGSHLLAEKKPSAKEDQVNFLISYDCNPDLFQATKNQLTSGGSSRHKFASSIASYDVSQVDLIVRWGGRRRLSGFLLQCSLSC